MADTTDKERDAKAALAEYLFNDPEIGPVMRDKIAKDFPKVKTQMPDVLIREQTGAVLAEVRKEREDFAAERQKDREQRAYQAAIDEIMSDPDLHITKDEIPIIEKKMKDEVIGTHRAAARLYRAEQQIAAPRSDVSQGPMEVPGLNGAGGDDYKDIVQNPELWGRKMATRILNDFRGNRGQRWL
jgi:hypothetical protein